MRARRAREMRDAPRQLVDFERSFPILAHTLTKAVKEQLAQNRLKREISKTFDLINPYLYSVEERIAAQAREFDPAVEGYISYACESRGKRIRPALTLLAGGATGGISSGHVDLAVVMELIHLATLVHDDIIDGAELRRQQPTANAKWGNALSVLLGDVLFAHALKLATAFHNNDISRRIAAAAADVCSGEIIQTQRRFDLKLTIPDYYRIIEMKTAALFAVAAELGALVSEASPDVIGAMKRFGLKLGTAYQIYDDCLDIAGDEISAGKSLGTDLKKGKLTLPVLVVLKNGDDRVRNELRALILGGDDDRVHKVAAIARDHGGLRYSVDAARRHIADACADLDVVPQNRHSNALREIAAYLDRLVSEFA